MAAESRRPLDSIMRAASAPLILSASCVCMFGHVSEVECVCMCVCVCERESTCVSEYMCVYVCVCVSSMCVGGSLHHQP